MSFLLEDGRFHNVVEDKASQMTHCKETKPSKYTPTTNSYDFTRRSGHQRYIIKLSIK
jgi:hypothetical protein